MMMRFSLFSRLSILMRLACVVLLLQLAACSTFKSNSNARFHSVDLGERTPVLFVGELDEKAEDITYLGWIKARVSRPSLLSKPPTKAMADIVLAELAKKQGAHAVTFVTYERNMFGSIKARGQAVRINSIVDDEMARKKAKVLRLQAKAEVLDVPVEEYVKAVEPNSARVIKPVSSVVDVLVNNNDVVDIVSVPRHELISVLDNLMLLREQASNEKNFDRYQLLTESIDMLKANK